MNLIELHRALRQLRLGGMAAVIETRLPQAQAEPMTPIDLISCLVSDELTRRSDRLLQRRQKQAQFRDSQKSLENFDFTFNKKMNRSLAFDLATATFIAKHEDALFLGSGSTTSRAKNHSGLPGLTLKTEGRASSTRKDCCNVRTSLRTGRRSTLARNPTVIGKRVKI